MDPDNQDRPAEGLFDAQLALPLAGAAAPAVFSEVQKRDGRREPFSEAKIAAAIARAAGASAPGEAEHAHDLAKAVRVHLWKQLGELPPHVDQIHDAVERVLVAMGRQRAALAFARARTHKTRRAGSPGERLGANPRFEEHSRDALAAWPGALFVRTGADTLAAWDRARIVAALERETGLRNTAAEAIALEVEQQIAAAGIEALTTSLVRELVDAKLAEHGLNAYRERHRRIGVPLHDTALILRGALPGAPGTGPAASDRHLARALKKEYALAQVYSPQVAEAHLRGDLHLAGLGEIDRYASAQLPLALAAGATARAGAPAHFLAALQRASRELREHTQAAIAWCAADGPLAEAIDGLDTNAIRQFAEMLVVTFHAREHTGDAPARMALAWPATQTSPGIDTFCNAILEIATAARTRGVILDGLELGFELDLPAIETYPPFSGASTLAAAAAAGVPMTLTLTRGSQAEPESGTVWLQAIALNLPRAARHAAELGGMQGWLERTMLCIAQAHQDKQRFMDDLWARGDDGPMRALRAWDLRGAPFNPARCATRIEAEGLHEAAARLTRHGGNIMDSAAFMLDHVRRACDAAAEATGTRLDLAAGESPEVSERFAALDNHTMEPGAGDQPAAYTTGVTINAPAAFESARALGHIAPFLDEVPPVQIDITDRSPASILALWKKLLLETNCPHLAMRATR